MFAGKTTKLVKLVRAAVSNPETYQSVLVLKPYLDTREGVNVPSLIRTHDGDEVRDGGETSLEPQINPLEASLGISERVMVCSADDPESIIGELPGHVPGMRLFVGVDEVQFFTPGWIEGVFEELLVRRSDVDVAVVGLDMDRDGKMFPGMLSVEGFAAKVSYSQPSPVAVTHEKLVAVCAVCGERNASRTFFKWRDVRGGSQVLIGGADLYEPRCYEHWLAR